jgi:hypothetical protein
MNEANHSSATRAAVLNDLATLEGLVEESQGVLSMSMLRWQLRHRQENGLSAACVRVGKRILISRSRYDAWLTSQIGA